MDELRFIQDNVPKTNAKLPQKVQDIFNSSHLKDQEMTEDYVDMSMSAVQKKSKLELTEQEEMNSMLDELKKDEEDFASQRKKTAKRNGWRQR